MTPFEEALDADGQVTDEMLRFAGQVLFAGIVGYRAARLTPARSIRLAANELLVAAGGPRVLSLVGMGPDQERVHLRDLANCQAMVHRLRNRSA